MATSKIKEWNHRMETSGRIVSLPRVHICVFDRECWRDYYAYGMPMRVYLRSKKLMREFRFTVLPNRRRSKRIWDKATPVEEDHGE